MELSRTKALHIPVDAHTQLSKEALDGGSVRHFHQQNGGFQKRRIKKEPDDEVLLCTIEAKDENDLLCKTEGAKDEDDVCKLEVTGDEEDLCGTSGYLGHTTPEDQQNGEVMKEILKQEEPEDEDHLYTSGLLQLFRCSVCPLSYRTEAGLHNHMERSHCDEYLRLIQTGRLRYKNLVSAPTSPGRHGTNTNSGGVQTEIFHCSYCGKAFHRQNHLQTHRRIHTGEKPYRCLQCRRHFSRQSTLHRHQLIHTGEKPFQCIQCGIGFRERGSLIQHQRIHTGERPYQCLQSVNRQSHLHGHLHIHTAVKSTENSKALSIRESGDC